jgi:transcription elongation factor Elf1
MTIRTRPRELDEGVLVTCWECGRTIGELRELLDRAQQPAYCTCDGCGMLVQVSERDGSVWIISSPRT